MQIAGTRLDAITSCRGSTAHELIGRMAAHTRTGPRSTRSAEADDPPFGWC